MISYMGFISTLAVELPLFVVITSISIARRLASKESYLFTAAASVVSGTNCRAGSRPESWPTERNRSLLLVSPPNSSTSIPFL